MPQDRRIRFVCSRRSDFCFLKVTGKSNLLTQMIRWIEEYNHDRPRRGLHGQTSREARARFAQTLTLNTAPVVWLYGVNYKANLHEALSHN